MARLASARGLLTTAAAAALLACDRGQDPQVQAPPGTGERATLMGVGDFAVGAGLPQTRVVNPFEGDDLALNDGRRLYGWFNCGGCHGGLGGGGIGPPFADDDWIYGGQPANIFQSIAQGRPNGMPAYGGLVPDDEIWRIVLYVRSLGDDARRDRPIEGREQGAR